jgi:hypothetical protein
LGFASLHPEKKLEYRMLDQLGTTPEEIALCLKALGIQGVRNTVRFLNPIVKYAKTRIHGAHDMDVITGTVLRIKLPNGLPLAMPLPEAVRVFLDKFNDGHYPELEATG